MAAGRTRFSTRASRPVFGAAAVAALLAFPAHAASVDWVQTYNNYGHTGANLRENTLSTANVSTLKLNWARSLGADVRQFVLNDHYVIARVPDDSGANLDLWYINYTNGETAWKINTGPDVPGANGTLATGVHRIFSECGLTDKVGYKYSGICAYRKDNGRLAWSFSNPCNCTPEAGVVSPLLYANGVVLFGYFNGGSEGQEYALAADAMSGTILGAYKTGGQGSLGAAGFVQAGKLIYFDCGEAICALGHGKGNLRWKHSLGVPSSALSAGQDGRVYVNLCNGPAGVIALDGGNGNPIWSYGASQCSDAPPAVSDGRVYVTGTDAKVHALDAATGTELWAAAPGTASSASLANGVMYVDGASGAPGASAYNAATGALLWNNQPHPTQYNPPPVIIDGMLFVANQACGSLCAYGLPQNPVGRRKPVAVTATTSRTSGKR